MIFKKCESEKKDSHMLLEAILSRHSVWFSFTTLYSQYSRDKVCKDFSIFTIQTQPNITRLMIDELRKKANWRKKEEIYNGVSTVKRI